MAKRVSKRKLKRLTPTETRKQQLIAAKEKRDKQMLMSVLLPVLALTMLILSVGAGREMWWKPTRPIARVNGETIQAGPFAKRIDYERRQTLNYLSSLQGLVQSSDTSFLTQMANSQRDNLASTTVDRLIDESLIRQESDERGISVDGDDVETYLAENALSTLLIPPAPAPDEDAAEGEEGDESDDASADEDAEQDSSSEGGEASEEDASTDDDAVAEADDSEPRYTKDEYEAAFKEYMEPMYLQAGLSRSEYEGIIEQEVLRERLNESLGEELATSAAHIEAEYLLFNDKVTADAAAEALASGDPWSSILAEYGPLDEEEEEVAEDEAADDASEDAATEDDPSTEADEEDAEADEAPADDASGEEDSTESDTDDETSTEEDAVDEDAVDEDTADEDSTDEDATDEDADETSADEESISDDEVLADEADEEEPADEDADDSESSDENADESDASTDESSDETDADSDEEDADEEDAAEEGEEAEPTAEPAPTAVPDPRAFEVGEAKWMSLASMQTRLNVDEEVATTLLALEKGDTSEAVQSTRGFLVANVVDRDEARELDETERQTLLDNAITDWLTEVKEEADIQRFGFDQYVPAEPAWFTEGFSRYTQSQTEQSPLDLGGIGLSTPQVIQDGDVAPADGGADADAPEAPADDAADDASESDG